jgi:hypothetical protein
MLNVIHAYVDNPFMAHCRFDIPAEGEGVEGTSRAQVGTHFGSDTMGEEHTEG